MPGFVTGRDVYAVALSVPGLVERLSECRDIRISALVAAWVAGAWMGTKEHVRQSFGATNREWNGSSPLHWKSQLNFNQTFVGARLPASEADRSSVQKAARKSIPNWNINTCNHGSESTLLRQPVHITWRLSDALMTDKPWKLATGVRNNYVVSCGALPSSPLLWPLTC